jgi:hypothetical protein
MEKVLPSSWQSAAAAERAAASAFPLEIQPQFLTRPSQVQQSLRRLWSKTVLAGSFECQAELEKSSAISGSKMGILSVLLVFYLFVCLNTYLVDCIFN